MGISEATQTLSGLLGLNEAINRSTQPEQILVCIQEFLRFWPSIEQITLIEVDNERCVLSICPDRAENQYPFLPLLLAWIESYDTRPLRVDIRDASMPESLHAALLTDGLRSLAVLPLFSGAAYLGYILLGSHLANPFDGTAWEWIQLTVAPVGPALHRIRCELEIAARRKAESALRESEMRYRELYENAPNAYFSVGNDGRIHQVNRQAQILTGYAAADLIGRSVLDIHSDSPENVSAQSTFAEFLEGREIWDREMQLKRADGSTIWVSLSVTPIRNRDGEVVASRSVVLDINERRALQEMRQAFVDMIVHDLRHPLGVIAASAEMLELEIAPDNEIGHQFVAFIHEAARQAISLVENILNVHRLEQGQMSVNIQNIPAGALIQKIAQEFSVYLAQHQIELALQLSSPLPIVRGDVHLLERVLRNLLDNAIKFTPAGGTIEIFVRSHFEAGQEGVRIAVIDHGPGISEETQSRLFRLYSTGSVPGSGFGVGLVFSKLAMEAMGGRIGLESVLGQGSTFFIFLPVVS